MELPGTGRSRNLQNRILKFSMTQFPWLVFAKGHMRASAYGCTHVQSVLVLWSCSQCWIIESICSKWDSGLRFCISEFFLVTWCRLVYCFCLKGTHLLYIVDSLPDSWSVALWFSLDAHPSAFLHTGTLGCPAASCQKVILKNGTPTNQHKNVPNGVLSRPWRT